jgi:hypothetical protein
MRLGKFDQGMKRAIFACAYLHKLDLKAWIGIESTRSIIEKSDKRVEIVVGVLESELCERG